VPSSNSRIVTLTDVQMSVVAAAESDEAKAIIDCHTTLDDRDTVVIDWYDDIIKERKHLRISIPPMLDAGELQAELLFAMANERRKVLTQRKCEKLRELINAKRS